MKRLLYFSLIFSAMLIAIVAVQAAEPEPAAVEAETERVYRTEPDGEGALTEQMIEDCILLKQDVETNYGSIDESRAKFEALNKEVSELGKSIQENKDKLDHFALNTRKDAYHAKLTELSELKSKYDAMSGPYKELVTKLNTECVGQKYYQDDYDRMVKKLGRGL